MIDQLVRHIKGMTIGEDFSLFLYGTGSHSSYMSRDIDAVAVFTHLGDVVYQSFPVIRASHINKRCNLYLLPYSVYRDDVLSLRYGGYYAYKFSLSFKHLLTQGKGVNAPFLFWKSHQIYFETRLKNGIQPHLLMKLVHNRIIQYNPTFLRSLIKFLAKTGERNRLREYIRRDVKGVELTGNNLQGKPKVRIDSDDNLEKSFFRYWAEYRRFKDAGTWGHRTVRKLRDSCVSKNNDLVRQYLRDCPLL